jgi:hypothetical protein
VPLFFLSGSALMLGFLHGLGVDHLMAIAALSVDKRSGGLRRRRVIRTAVQFACGHTLVLGGGLVLALTFGWVLPSAIESGAQRAGGLLLVLLGAAGLWSVWSGLAYGHVHTETDGRPRWHVHFSARTVHPHAEKKRAEARKKKRS